MKVFFFVSEYDRYNGGQRSLKQLLIGLPAEGIEPTVIFPSAGRCSQAFEDAGINSKVLIAPDRLLQFGQHLMHTSLWRKMFDFIVYILPYSLKVYRLMLANNVNILHCNTSRSLLLASPIPFLFRKKIIWHVRGELNGLSKSLKSICEGLATSIWLVAAKLKNQLSKHAAKKLFVIYNGIDASSFSTINAKHKSFDGNNVTICTFAAVTPFKGYHHLIDAAIIVNNHYYDKKIKFLAVGDLFDQEYLEFLNNKISGSKLNNMEFLGWKDNPLEYYNMADIVVLPTVNSETLVLNGKSLKIQTGEGLPRTVLEAMFLNKVVVATIVAGSPEQIVDGESGFLVNPSNKRHLAETIIKAIDMPFELRDKMQKAAGIRAREVFGAKKLTAIAAQKLKTLK
ncbi:MAG TPA: glycosyltransferase family 4 protein [Fulvivirga sp.]|nr:glycosyltransferase family 4 protein [Fulvivirga sp.]